MAVRFTVNAPLNLVVFTYSGAVGLQESIQAIADAARHPGYRPFMRQLCDLTAVTAYERNFPELLKMQARIVEDLLVDGAEMTVVFLAPGRKGQEMAQMAQKSWAGLDAVRVLIVDHAEAAADCLGLPLAEPSRLQGLGA